MTTLRTAVDLTPTRLRVDVSAGVTFLRAVRGPDKLDRSTGPILLVTKHLLEHRPSRICDPTRTVPTHHRRHVQVLQHNDAVTLGVPCRLDVRKMSALSTDLAEASRDVTFGFFSVFGSFLSAGNGSLRTGKLFQRRFQVLRAGNQLSVGGTGEVGDAAIDRDHRPGTWSWIWKRDLTDERCEPLISVADERAALGRSFKRTMNDSTDLPKLGEVESRVDELPNLGMWFAQVDVVDALSLPVRSVRKFLETSLPGFVEFVKKLHRDVSRNVREPRQVRSKLGQILRLIERGHVAALAAISCQSEKPLLVREVPQEPQRITPAIRRRNLFPRRIDTAAEGFADQHLIMRNTVVRQWTRRSPRPKRRASALETR